MCKTDCKAVYKKTTISLSPFYRKQGIEMWSTLGTRDRTGITHRSLDFQFNAQLLCALIAIHSVSAITF